jgi:hypothetical protein
MLAEVEGREQDLVVMQDKEEMQVFKNVLLGL